MTVIVEEETICVHELLWPTYELLSNFITENSTEKHTHYEEVVQRKIHPIFEGYINPRNALHIFWKYNPNVLVKKDIVRPISLHIFFMRKVFC